MALPRTPPLPELEIATAARVRLRRPLAGLGARATAYFLDWFVLLCFWLAVAAAASASGQALLWYRGATTAAWVLAILAFAFVNTIYWIWFETRMQGQTPGKRAEGIRVVMDDGRPVTFFAVVARTLLRTADFLPFAYGAGLACGSLHPQGKRLGDLVAGTVVVYDEPRELSGLLDRLAAPAQPLEGQAATLAQELRLPPALLETVASYLQRRRDFEPEARRALAFHLAGRIRGLVLASGAPPERLAALDRVKNPETFLEALLARPE